MDGIDISVEVPTEPIEPGPVEGGPNADATASFDFGTGEGDQGQTELEGVGPGADFDVAVYFQGVTDLAGFTVTVGFPPDQLAFNGAEESNASEGTNIERTAGGTALFLPASLKADSLVEFGGAILAPSASTAPDGSGLAGVFSFKTSEIFEGTATVWIDNVVFRGLAVSDTVNPAVVATIKAPGEGEEEQQQEILGNLLLDLDISAGNQDSRSKFGVGSGEEVEVQLTLIAGAEGSKGFKATLEYTGVTYEGFTAGQSWIGLFDDSQTGLVEVGAAALGTPPLDVAAADLGVVKFKTSSSFTDAFITLTTYELSKDEKELFEGLRTIISLSGETGGAPTLTADFVANGIVDFDDFFAFAGAFGQPATGDFAKFDLDQTGETIDFGDFFVFAGAFGTSGVIATKPVGIGPIELNQDSRMQLQAVQSDRSDVVEVDLLVSGSEGVTGYGAVVTYDPGSLSFIGSRPAGNFESGGEGRPVLGVSDGSGRVSLGDVLVSGTEVGDGVLARLRFNVLSGDALESVRLSEGVLVDGAGRTEPIAGIDFSDTRVRPLSYGLGQNYPNPFNPVTQIVYQVPESGQVRLVVYNLLGQEVRRLVEGRVSAGFYQAVWDGRDDRGRSVSSGLYFYRMEAEDFSQVRKMVLLK